MSKKKILKGAGFCGLLLFVLNLSWMTNSCTREMTLKLDAVCGDSIFSYGADILPLVNASCAVPTCHVPGGDGEGDYTSYTGLKGNIDNGTFETQVFDLKEMPDTSTGVLPLTEDEINMFKCWIAIGYPEN